MNQTLVVAGGVCLRGAAALMAMRYAVDAKHLFRAHIERFGCIAAQDHLKRMTYITQSNVFKFHA